MKQCKGTFLFAIHILFNIYLTFTYNKTDTKTAEFKRPPAKKFPPKQIPDTEVVEPKNRERLRGY